MRLCSVLVGAALLASGLASAREATSGRFTVAGAALAATPMAFFLIGSINPSGFEIAAAFATWLAWLELLSPPPAARRRGSWCGSAVVVGRRSWWPGR